jgi:hypothetical protein
LTFDKPSENAKQLEEEKRYLERLVNAALFEWLRMA